MKSGRKTLAEIEDGIGDLRRKEKTLQAELERDNARHVSALEERTGAFRGLAELRARAAVSDGVIDRADRLEVRVARILEARQKTIDALKARDHDAHERRDSLNAHAAELRKEIDGLEARLDEVGQRARAELESDATYIRLIETRDEKAETFRKADEKTKRAEQDRVEKGKSYENDLLFMYLWNRQFGRKAYEASGLIKMGDEWVARLVGYHEARANYAILNEIPERLRAHCDVLADDLASATAKADDVLAERIKVLAGSDLTAALMAARDSQDANNLDLEKTEAEIADLSVQINRYAEGLDEPFQEAVSLSAAFLEQESYFQLLALAKRTNTDDDDDIVKQIKDLNDDIKALTRGMDERRRELDRLGKRRNDLIEVAGNFRRRRYDDDNSFFEPDDFAEDMLELLLRGGLTAAEFWLRSQGSHRWRGRSADPFRRSGGFPPFGGGWGGGGGRRRSGGGGRFRTGGGF